MVKRGSTEYKRGSTEYKRGSTEYKRGSTEYKRGSTEYKRGSTEYKRDVNTLCVPPYKKQNKYSILFLCISALPIGNPSQPNKNLFRIETLYIW